MIAEMLAALVNRHKEIAHVVDVGAGNGRLLEELSVIRPDLRLLGIDLRTRPESLAGQVGVGARPVGRAIWVLDNWRGRRRTGRHRANHDHLLRMAGRLTVSSRHPTCRRLAGVDHQ